MKFSNGGSIIVFVSSAGVVFSFSSLIVVVFVNGELKWQNHNYSQGTPKTTDSVELVLAPRIEYVMKISKTLRFKRPKDKTIKTFLKIEASQVENVYQNDEQLWP